LSAAVVGGPTSARERVLGEVKLGGVAILSRSLIASTGDIGAARTVLAALAGFDSVTLAAAALKRFAITALIMLSNDTVVLYRSNNKCVYTFSIAILNLVVQILAIVQLVAVLVFQYFSRKKTAGVGSDVQSVLLHVCELKDSHAKDMTQLKKDMDFYFYFEH
jgi:hypothetical protein